ncbi:MAG: hypothetical protein AMJ42_04555 [Deltaproteobacteria bacterium DG_8]|nr:MAG: hypothetical protein AMJ42_04555 [Deltaproteobacteria bacterium DG_8]
MIEISGDMFKESMLEFTDAICITTNGALNAQGKCVMGRGVALIAKEKWNGIDKRLGDFIKINGNIVQILWYVPSQHTTIVAFPVKHHWKERADLKLIETSCKQLKALMDQEGWKKVILPRPGCNNGKRDWDTEVKPILQKHFRDDNRLMVIRKDL